MDLSPIAVPYHLGRPEIGAARGPDRILQAGDSRQLDLTQIRVAPSAPFANEVATTMNVDADLAERVRRELAGGRMPVAIAADCISCLGTLGGLTAGLDARAERIGAVWLDAHGDFNTAASSPTGYLDGMALAAAVGREWGTVAAGIPGVRPFDPANIIHLGGRDFDQGEAVRLVEWYEREESDLG